MLMKSRENRPKIALSLFSYDRFMDFRDEFGEELVFRKTGFLSAVPESQAERYGAEHDLRLAMGAPSVKLTASEVTAVTPGVRTDDLAFAILGPDDGEISAEQILAAYERRARDLGVTICFGEIAIGIESLGDRIVAVRTNKRDVPCGIVVNAAGASALEVGEWVGLRLPLSNLRRSLYFGRTADPAFQSGPMVEDADLEWYYRPLGGRTVLVGMGREHGGPPTEGPNLEYLPEVRRAAAHRAPGLADFELTGGVSGIRSLTPDILPIIGPVAGLDGYLNLCGWGGEGIMHSPAGGALIADWVNSTSTCPVPRDLFLYERFVAASDFSHTRVHIERSSS